MNKLIAAEALSRAKPDASRLVIAHAKLISLTENGISRRTAGSRASREASIERQS